MKIKPFIQLILSGWVLGLVIAVPVILFMPRLFNKYKADLVLQESAAHPTPYRIYHRDLDGNGIRQKIYAFQNGSGQLSFQYFKDDGSMDNQINFSHKFSANLSYLVFGDVNQNGRFEVYGFTMEKDSLFLNWKEITQPFTNTTHSLFISRVGTFNNGNTNVLINRLAVLDLDNDHNNEIVISIVAGYSKFPRTIMVIHPETGKMEKTEDVGINPYYLTFYDRDTDGKFEMFASSSAGFNLADSIDENTVDSRPYLLGYGSDLKMLFPPVPFSSGIYNKIQFYINSAQRKEIVVFQFNRSRSPDKMIRLYRVDFFGNLKDSIFLSEYGKRFNYQVFRFDGKFWLYTGDNIVVLDEVLKIIQVSRIENSTQIFKNPVIVNGSPEFVTIDHLLTKACIYTENFTHKVEKKFSDEKIKSILMDFGKNPDDFMIQTDHNEYTYHFSRNGLYYLKFPVYLVIYLLSVGFVWLVQNIRERQLHEKFELTNQLKEMEIKYLRMQMDPHFMFNAFTTMALLIKNGNRNEAFESFMKFTRMLRSNFDFSDYFTRPLNEELQTVRDYLEINKLRFKEKLNYEISVAEDVPGNMLIPKMMIQIHVENSLKHGLSQMTKTGEIRIKVEKNGDFICLSVEDNGIGRKKAASLNRPSTKQGIKMLHALMERLNQQNKLRVTQTYIDLEDEGGNPGGTRVEILVPLNLKESVN